MGRLENLIKELCPDGVVYKKLSDVVSVERGKRVVREQLSQEFGFPVFQNSLTSMGYHTESNYPANTSFVIGAGAAGEIGYSKEDFWAADDCFPIVCSDSVIDRYVFHFLLWQKPVLLSKVRKASIPRLSRAVIEALKIPVPPIEVQSEIVRILDNFTELTSELISELTSELTARKKQYEYYRDSLLTFGDDVPVFALSELAQYSKDRIDANRVDADSYIGVDNLLQQKKGKVQSSCVPTSGRLTKYHKNDVLIGNIRPYLRKIWFADNDGGTNGDVLAIQTISDKVNPKYLFVQLSSEAFFNYDTQNSKGAKMPRGDKDAVMRYPIPVPSLEVQERIIGILDRFDALCNDISAGLPAEIEARQKQYEYYRDKLLNFKEMSV